MEQHVCERRPLVRAGAEDGGPRMCKLHFFLGTKVGGVEATEVAAAGFTAACADAVLVGKTVVTADVVVLPAAVTLPLLAGLLAVGVPVLVELNKLP